MTDPFPPSSSGWLEISIHLPPVAHDPLSAFLFDLGCTGIVSEDFQDHTLKAYLPFQEDLEDIRSRIEVFLQNLKEVFPEAHSPKWTLKKIEDRDWSRNWRRFFRSERGTPRVMIVPAWESLPPSFEGHVIRIDPGPAFGTGHILPRVCALRPWKGFKFPHRGPCSMLARAAESSPYMGPSYSPFPSMSESWGIFDPLWPTDRTGR